MGGFGSSRWGWHARKTTVEECCPLAISSFTRKGFIGPNIHQWGISWWQNAGTDEVTARIGWEMKTVEASGWLRLYYTITPRRDPENERAIDYRVPLETTEPHFGGLRWWFRCPGPGCRGQRVAKLYKPPSDDHFLCRTCYDLVYRSSQEHDKAMDRYKHMSTEQLLALLDGDIPNDFRAAMEVLHRHARIYRYLRS